MVGMRDVGARAGVSAKTVSRVFNDDPRVSPETRARVEDALRELGYVPNGLATTFRAGRSPVVGIAVPDLVDPFFASIAKTVSQVVARHGLSVAVTSLGDDADRERGIVEALLRQSVTGLIIAPISHDQSYLAAWTGRTPTVFVDRSPSRVAADSFVEDDHGGAYLATVHLIDHGHRRIAFLGDAPDVSTTRNRHAGYLAALADRHLEVDPRLTAFGASNPEGAARALDQVGAAAPPPTAVFSSDARCTMALVPALRSSRLAVTGFGDFPLADMVVPALTVVDQDPAEVGRLAAERIVDRVDHPARRFRRKTVLAVDLVERESCLTPEQRRSRRAEAGGGQDSRDLR